MTLEEQLKLERYKLVTDRQKYFTELARSSFASYIKVFTYLCAGAITLISVRSSLQIDAKLLLQLIKGIAILVTFLGVVSSGQIVFCLVRWYGFHRAEAEINKECPKAERWAWIFEGLYIVAIVISIFAAWFGSSILGLIIQTLNPK
jgi:hypothetical protein